MISGWHMEMFKLFGFACGGFDRCDDLWWRSYGENDPDHAPGVFFYINCNDLFYWGCSDAEELTEENFPVLVQAIADVQAACPDMDRYRVFGQAQTLFACRVRQERPQGCCYPKDRRLWPLIDACGPERETGIGNPYKPGEREEKLAKIGELTP